MLDIAADLGDVGPFSVAVNPDGSILICSSDQAMARQTEQRAPELGIEVTVSSDCVTPERYPLP